LIFQDNFSARIFRTSADRFSGLNKRSPLTLARALAPFGKIPQLFGEIHIYWIQTNIIVLDINKYHRQKYHVLYVS